METWLLWGVAALTLLAAIVGAYYSRKDYRLGKRQERRDKEFALARPAIRWDHDKNAAVVENRGTQDAQDLHIEIFQGFATTGVPKGTGQIEAKTLLANSGNREVVISDLLQSYSDNTDEIRRKKPHRRPWREDFTCVIWCRTPLGNPSQYTSRLTIPWPEIAEWNKKQDDAS